MPGRRGSGAPRRGGAAGPVRGPPAGGSRDPISLLLIDGRNVQYALGRGTGASGVTPSAPLPTATLIPRLRAAFSPPTEVELILDGHAAGSPQGKIAPGFVVSFTRSRIADEVIVERATEAARAAGPVGAWSVVVVTDDREVRDGSRRSGVRVEGTAWLADRLAGRIASAPRAPAAPGSPAGPRSQPLSGRARAGQSLGHGRAPKPGRPSQARGRVEG